MRLTLATPAGICGAASHALIHTVDRNWAGFPGQVCECMDGGWCFSSLGLV